MEKPEVKPAVCEVGQGTLPGCAALAFPYIPMQSNNPTRYSRTEALQTGTLFPGLDLPFKAAIQARTKLPNTALVELMARLMSPSKPSRSFRLPESSYTDRTIWEILLVVRPLRGSIESHSILQFQARQAGDA